MKEEEEEKKWNFRPGSKNLFYLKVLRNREK